MVHHAIYRILYPYFDKKFIFDSYSCRLNKGTHKAINRFKYFGLIVSKNNTRTCCVLKGDIKKFFTSIDHGILKNILAKHIKDQNALWLLNQVIDSFKTKQNFGLPLGSLTSQLLVNIYMNEFDQFIKHKLKIKYYLRYADDFVILSDSKDYLKKLIPQLNYFLNKKLNLSLHPNKLYLKTLSSGIDFLGWVNFPKYRVLRTSTKKRMFKKLENNKNNQVLDSYKGLLSHGQTYKIFRKIVLMINNS